MIKALEELKYKLEKEGSPEYLESVKDIIKYAKKKKKALYVGVFLTPTGAQMLDNWWGTVVQKEFLAKHFSHHMTIKFKPSPEEVVSLPIGEDVTLKIIGYGEDDKGQAVMVSGVRSSNDIPHITVSTAEGVSPVYSNELLGMGITEVDGPELDARIGFHNGKEVRYDFEGSVYE
tara:strand:+ start:402 stop:926 length:525 start_codon:yes stop_codon:yes gene_type:complete